MIYNRSRGTLNSTIPYSERPVAAQPIGLGLLDPQSVCSSVWSILSSVSSTVSPSLSVSDNYIRCPGTECPPQGPYLGGGQTSSTVRPANHRPFHHDAADHEGCVLWNLKWGRRCNLSPIFYRAMLCIAQTMLSQDVCPSVRLSVCLFVTRRYSPLRAQQFGIVCLTVCVIQLLGLISFDVT